MKKILINVSDDAHDALLEEQYQRKKKKLPKTSLAEIAADFIEGYVNSIKKASQK